MPTKANLDYLPELRRALRLCSVDDLSILRSSQTRVAPPHCPRLIDDQLLGKRLENAVNWSDSARDLG